jgi:hypothetical protein
MEQYGSQKRSWYRRETTVYGQGIFGRYPNVRNFIVKKSKGKYTSVWALPRRAFADMADSCLATVVLVHRLISSDLQKVGIAH